MPLGSSYANSMAQLAMAAGSAQADAVRQKGALWGQAMADLGRLPGDVLARRQARTKGAMEADAYGRQRAIDALTLEDTRATAEKRKRMQEVFATAEDLPAALMALERIDPQAALDLQNKLLTTGMTRIETLARLAPTVKDQASHMAARKELSALGISVPLTYTPDWWHERTMAAMTGKEQIDLLRQQREDRQAETQQGVRRMVGEFVTQQGGRPIDEGTQQTLRGIGFQEGINVESVLPKEQEQRTPTEATLALAAAKGDQQASEALRLLQEHREKTGNQYFVPVQTGQGLFGFDTRTNTLGPRLADLKPGETAQREIANARTTATVLKQVIGTIDEKTLGPVIGRYKSVEAALVGNDPTFATFSAAVSTLQNTVINLRTGAQMSEPEARRILNEIPDVKLPPATFIAKAKQSQKYFEEWLKNRASVAYGRTTTSDVDTMVTPQGVSAPADLGRVYYDENGNEVKR